MSGEPTPRSTPGNSPPGTSKTVQLRRKPVKCPDFFGYLKRLPLKSLEKLYHSPAACLAVLRELPPMAQQLVFRLLFLDKPVARTAVNAWTDKDYLDELDEAVDAMDALGIWYNASGHTSVFAFVLSDVFRLNVRVALFGGGQPWTMEAKHETDPKKIRDVVFLDKYASERWDCLLHFMVGVDQRSGDKNAPRVDTNISADTKQVLIHAGLMKSDDDEVIKASGITSAGFQFLLMPRSEQVWFFLTMYLDTVESRLGVDVSVPLGFLCQLSFATLGQAYNSDGLNDSLQAFLQHLRELGLVYQRKRKEGIFYPTRLSLGVAAGLKNGGASVSRGIAGGEKIAKDGFLVVETNYRVYAYTDSELSISLLSLFSEILHRFPGMVVAVISRDSVRAALRSGITAAQIVDFLKMHAHPEMHRTAVTMKYSTVIPPTVWDQIHLWEKERERITFTEGIAYSQFMSASEFETLRDFATEKGYSLWDSDQKRTLIVVKEAHEDLRKFWKRQSK